MDWNFGVMELIFLVSCIIIFVRGRMQRAENEIDRVLREAEQVKFKNMDILICKSEVYDGQIFIYNRKTNVFITQQPTIESTFKYFIDNYPGRRIHFGEE
jgi:hypothetical protein